MSAPIDVSLESKLAFLGRPAAFPDRTATVERIETHFAWVFLCDRHAYKLKKPIRFEAADFTMPAQRERNCRIEVELNRRLAARTYIGVVALTLDRSGLALDGPGHPVDWLVKMRRLPQARMLTQAAAEGGTGDDALDALMRKLAGFYSRTACAPWDGTAYASRLRRQIAHYAARLQHTGRGIDTALAATTIKRQQQFLCEREDLFVQRVAERRVVDAHGDLKPEHVCLLDDPQIIDCLEFDAELRLLDAAEEIAFLALECTRLGYEPLAGTIRARYAALADDRVPPALWDFYASSRSLVRAYLGATRLLESGADEEKWRRRTHWYLAFANRRIRAALARA